MKYLDVPSSGSIADRTHSHNRAGQYTRNRRAPVQPVGTGRRAFVRANFGAASTAWGAITNAQRMAWDGFAADHPYVDALGQSIILTGHQMFVAMACNLQNVEESIQNEPPASTAVPDVSTTTLTPDISSGIVVTWTVGLGSDFVTVSFSKIMGPGRSYNKTFWQPASTLGYALANTGTKTVTTAVYAAEFGTPTVGKKLFAKVTPINQYGFAGTPAILQGLWVA